MFGSSGATKMFNFSGMLEGLSKTLNLANQAIPLYREAKPILTNAKSAWKITRDFLNRDSKSIPKKTTTNNIQNKKTIHISKPINSPQFFL